MQSSGVAFVSAHSRLAPGALPYQLILSDTLDLAPKANCFSFR